MNNNEIIEITYDELKILNEARNVITNVLSIESNFYSVCESFKAMEINYFTSSMDEMLYFTSTPEDFYQTRNSYNAFLLAALATIRLYTHSIIPHSLKILGKTVSKDNLKKILKNKSDNIYEYRVMEAIRNYSQHQAFPVHGLSIGSGWINDKNLSSTDYFFHASEVTDSDRFEEKVLSEINHSGGRINLRGVFRVYFDTLCDIHIEFRNLILPKLRSSEQVIAQMRSRWQKHANDKSLVGVVGCRVEGGFLCKSVSPVYLKASGDETLGYLMTKMASFANMDKRSVKI